jgi:SNF2 family DNA or RNA helicase
VLVFTNFKMTQRMLRRVFEERYGIRVSIINGDTPASAAHRSLDSRQQVVEHFNASEGFSVLVLSPIAAGFGLNIQGANHVVHFTRHWNPAKEAQATDRAYRIGQQLPVSVYYPMSLSSRFSTFDARLHELLASKKALADESLVPSEEVKLADFRMG